MTTVLNQFYLWLQGKDGGDQQEELDFMFDEEIEQFEGIGRKNNFSEW